MSKPTRFIATLLALTGFVSHAVAGPINYSEGVDLNNTALGALDVGINSVTGGVCLGANCNDGGDDFTVALSTGLVISSITFEVTNFNSVTNMQGGVGDTFLLLSHRSFTGNGFKDVFKQQVSGANTLTLSTGIQFADPSLGAPEGSYSYRWSFTVEREQSPGQVPEPMTLSMVGAGLAALGLSRRRRG